MKIVVFDENGSHTAQTEDGTLSWSQLDSNGCKSVSNIQMFEYKELSLHKFIYTASFRPIQKDELITAIIENGYSV